MTFDELIGPLLEREGGYSNNAADRGGATNYGITQKVYSDWNYSHARPWADVRGMTQDEAVRIYHDLYWMNSHCDEVPANVREIHFDAAVQHGVGSAVKFLQGSSGASMDGVFGPNTKACVEAVSPELLLARYIAIRYRFYGRIIINDRTQLVFMRGWMSRMQDFS